MLAFWMGGATAPVAGGTGVLIFPEFEIDGTGTFVAWFRPSYAVLVFPKFRLRGTGVFFIPLPEEPPCIPCINRQILITLYGWGVIDVSTQFSFDPCGLGEDEPPLLVSAGEPVPTAQELEKDRQKAERARDLAIQRQLAREADPNYIVPTALPAPTIEKELPVDRLAFEVSIPKTILLGIAGTTKQLLLHRVEPIAPPSIEPVAEPQAVIKKAELKAEKAPIIPPAPFEVRPAKALPEPKPGKVSPMKVPEQPTPSKEEVAPPQPVKKKEVEPPKQSPNIRHQQPMVRNPRKGKKK